MLFDARFPDIELHQSHDLAGGLHILRSDVDIRLVLIDLDLPDSSGTDSLPRLRACAPEVRLVVLSADERRATVERAIELGASGFVPKTAQSDVLTQALRIILDGGVYLPAQRQALQRGTQAAQPEDDPVSELHDVLSARQLQVLQLLIAGKSNKLICRELGLSESTVKTHLDAIFRRLQVSNRTQAVMAAARLGLRFNH